MSKFKTYREHQKFYNSTAWKKKRKEILERDNHECQWCKAQGKVTVDNPELRTASGRKKIQLVVHHRMELKDYPELALNDDNLVTWCWEHHEFYHNRSNGNYRNVDKKVWTDEQW